MNSISDDSWIELTPGVIDSERLIRFVTTPTAGAVLLFLGTVRELTNGRRTVALDYTAYPEMAMAEIHKLVAETRSQWPIQRIAIVHRLGHLELTEASIGIAVSSPHRADAFTAGQFLIDEFKRRVPVWKKENWDDGSTEWVHPGMTNGPP
ncbi:molybdenum cofactor biosynthesis protein MoaE [Planctomicrobium sp. SH664]|uniref:molybdenum cofactor biosynthesis protein MoaE n=1 Tax=Planctomicrobium sp. SH664 TaxID=3448125 RepID=UPI003F5BCFFD